MLTGVAHRPFKRMLSQFCEFVFEEDRSQEGQTDMECFDDLLSRLKLQPDHHLLDLGCGAGGCLSMYSTSLAHL